MDRTAVEYIGKLALRGFSLISTPIDDMSVNREDDCSLPGRWCRGDGVRPWRMILHGSLLRDRSSPLEVQILIFSHFCLQAFPRESCKDSSLWRTQVVRKGTVLEELPPWLLSRPMIQSTVCRWTHGHVASSSIQICTTRILNSRL